MLTVREAPPSRPKDPGIAARDQHQNNKLKTKGSSVAAMSRAQQQQQPWARPFDWSLRRNIITQLYILDDLPLKEVEEIMREEFQFYATQKMYKDHFRKWGLRKNLSSQFVEDLLIRKGQQNSPGQAHIPNGAVIVRNLNRRVSRYVRSGPGLGPNAELVHLLNGMNRPLQSGSPGNMGHAEKSMYVIKDYVTAMDSMSSKSPKSGALGPAYNTAAGNTYYWITLIGIARNFLHENRFELGFALLNQCFDMFTKMLDPSPWLILAAFHGAFDLARIDPRLGTIFMQYIDELTNVETASKPHAFHTLFAILRKSGSEGVLKNFEAVILECFMDLMTSRFAEKRPVLEIMRSFSCGFFKAYPVTAPTIEASRATVQKAFDKLKGNPDSLVVKPIAVKGRPKSALQAIVCFPKSPMENFLKGWASTRPASTNSSPSASSSDEETTTSPESPKNEEEGSSRADSPAVFDPLRVETIFTNVIGETLVEMHSGNLSVSARMIDLKDCFDPSSSLKYTDIEELSLAYTTLRAFYASNAAIYLQ
ncbi:Clr5 domain-containing protein [Apiospora arundinis]